LGRETESVQLREKAAQFPPSDIDSTYLKGLNQMRRREFDKARQNFEKIQDSHPENFASRFFLAICLLKQNRPREAQVALSACIAQRPYFLWSYFFRGQLKVAIQDLTGATDDFRRVLELSPSDPIRQAVQAQLMAIEKDQAKVSLKPVILPAH
jgi:tetratricopeptide (TPR) repeat protein